MGGWDDPIISQNTSCHGFIFNNSSIKILGVEVSGLQKLGRALWNLSRKKRLIQTLDEDALCLSIGKFWEGACVSAVFSGVFETGDPRIQHINSVSAGEARFWGLKLAGDPCLYCIASLVKAKFVSLISIKVIEIYKRAWPWVTNKNIFDH